MGFPIQDCPTDLKFIESISKGRRSHDTPELIWLDEAGNIERNSDLAIKTVKGRTSHDLNTGRWIDPLANQESATQMRNEEAGQSCPQFYQKNSPHHFFSKITNEIKNRLHHEEKLEFAYKK